MRSLGFIGVGNMGLALLRGFAGSRNCESVNIFGYDAYSDKKTAVESCGGTWVESELEIIRNCKYILLALKHQSVSEVLGKIKGELTLEHVVISICAGVSADFIRENTIEDLKVVCVMPNTPMMLGLGASAISHDEKISPDELKFIRSVIDSCGISEIIPADKMNQVICINASSPAYIYLFAKCFVDYAAEQGIDPKAAMNLFSQTLVGAGKMLSRSGMAPEELIVQVCSKGGTTIAGYDKLLEHGFADSVKAACEACSARARELMVDN